MKAVGLERAPFQKFMKLILEKNETFHSHMVFMYYTIWQWETIMIFL